MDVLEDELFPLVKSEQGLRSPQVFVVLITKCNSDMLS